jgi:RHS repeat-associated protein
VKDLTLGFGYNPAGQMASATRSNDAFSWTGHGSGGTASTADGLNRLADHGGVALTYDPKGNLVSDGTRSFGYSSENLALTEAFGGSTITRTYDPLTRLSSTVATGSSAPTDFLWFGEELIGEYFKGNVAGLYVHGPGVDEPLVLVNRYGARIWLHADERGSVIAGSDPAGAASHVNTYDEYGRGGSLNGYRFGFTGQMRLSGDFHYYKARMYDPGLGRFLQPDPIGYGGGMNMYAYVNGDPVNFTDPLGLDEEPNDLGEAIVTGKRLKADSPSLTGWAALMGSGRGGWGPIRYFGDGGAGGSPPAPVGPPLPEDPCNAPRPTGRPSTKMSTR